MSFALDALAARLLTGPGEPPPPDGRRRAAVAALLHLGPHGPAVLLMKRAERHGDPWSGHVSLPGGRHEPADPDLHATAIRETAEELAVGLVDDARYLGRLPTLHPHNAGPNGMEVTPFVFVTAAPPPVRLSAEAVATFWLPMPLVAAGRLDAIYEYPGPPGPMRFPCWQWEGYTVWGLTMRILGELLAAGRPA